jgi:hypothetical protein
MGMRHERQTAVAPPRGRESHQQDRGHCRAEEGRGTREQLQVVPLVTVEAAARGAVEARQCSNVKQHSLTVLGADGDSRDRVCSSGGNGRLGFQFNRTRSAASRTHQQPLQVRLLRS